MKTYLVHCGRVYDRIEDLPSCVNRVEIRRVRTIDDLEPELRITKSDLCDAVAIIASRHKILAIRVFRSLTSWGLAESKRAVEELMDD